MEGKLTFVSPRPPVDVQPMNAAVERKIAAARAKPRPACTRRECALTSEPAHGFQEHRIVRVRSKLRLPEFLRAIALAFRPQDLAQVRRDFRVGTVGQRSTQE